MTRTHAAYQLLRHGALTPKQFRQITGWTAGQCRHTIYGLVQKGSIRRLSGGYYGVVA